MGGDYTQAGADLRRILTGQAGADVRVWQEGFGKAISDIAQEQGGKIGQALGGAVGENLTKTFNKLKPEERYQLVEAAVERLGPATAAAAQHWAGLTSTVQTLGVWLLRVAGGQAFDRIKSRLVAWTEEGGLFGRDGKNKMEKMARAVGVGFGNIIDRALDGFERVFNYVSNNWEDILDQFRKVVAGIKTAAKLAVAAGAGRTVAGAGVVGVGMGVSAIGGIIKAAPSIMMIAGAVGGLGTAALIALPVLALLGLALFGIGTLAVGAVAVFIDQMDELQQSFLDGSLIVEPLYEAAGLLWWRLTQMGMAIFGTSSAVDTANGGLELMVWGMNSLAGAMAFTLRAMWLVQFGWNALTLGLKAVYLGVVGIVQGLLWAMTSVLEAIPGGDQIIEKMGNPLEKIQGHTAKVMNSIETDVDEARSTKLLEGADALENYKAGLGEGVKTKVEGAFGRPGAGAGSAGDGSNDPKRPGGGNTYIRKVVVQQDLRGERPDRVIGFFNKALKQASSRRGSAFTQTSEAT